MRISDTTSSGDDGLRWKPLKVSSLPGDTATSWNAPAKLLTEPSITSFRLCVPVRGLSVLLLADAVTGASPPWKPSQNPTNGGPSCVMGCSKLGLTNRFCASARELKAANTSSAAKATHLKLFICKPSESETCKSFSREHRETLRATSVKTRVWNGSDFRPDSVTF